MTRFLDTLMDYLPLVLIALAVGWFGWIFISSNSDTSSFNRQCVAAHGHMYGTGLTLCLTSDGRIIEVYP